MTLAGFEPAIPASERPQTHALDRAATGIGIFQFSIQKYKDEGVQNYNFACCFVCVWNLVLHAEGGTEAGGVEE